MKGSDIRSKINTAVILIIIFSAIGGVAVYTFLILVKKRKNRKIIINESENLSSDENGEKGGENI